MSHFFLPKDVIWILDTLESAGYRADIVGGPVRDLIRGVEPHDFDITTSALPEQTKAVFSGERIVETGIKHGTVSLIKNGEQYEITTYRVDGEYEDNRHPKSVYFTDRIEEDLARRDFKVNAIAYSPARGITDPFGGALDIEKKLISAVGRAEDRFEEDALRILRGIRFASVLDFEIDEKTKAAMIEKSHLLRNISAERIFVEWKKLLSGKRALDVLAEFCGITSVFFPEAKIPENINRDAFAAASPMAKHVSLSAAAGAKSYADAMHRLKTDRVTIDSGKAAISAIGNYKNDSASLAFMLRDLGFETAKLAVECEMILGLCDHRKMELLSATEVSGVPYKLSMLNIDGSDLLSMGFSGFEIGKTLIQLQEKVILGELKNEKELLKNEALKQKSSLTEI